MTREQYQQKYGVAPSVPPSSSQPIRMTKAQYEQKYGQSVVPEKKSLGGFAGNVVKSGGRLIGDTVGAVANIFNPNMEKNTVANLGKLAIGTAQYLDPTQVLGTQFEDTAKSVGNFYKDRYGGLDKIGNTLYNDPIGALADVAAVATGVGGAIKGGVSAATRAGTVARAGNVARAATVGSKLAKVGNAIDPIQVAGRGIGATGSKLFSRAKPAVLARADDMVTAGIGNPVKQANASQKAGRSVASFIDEYDLYDRTPETAGRVKSDILSKYDDLALRSGKQVQTKQLVEAFNKEIEKLQAGVGGVVSDANQSKIAELIRRRDQLLQAGGGAVSDGQLMSSPLSIGADTLTNFRRNVIDPDVPASMFNLDARGSGVAQGAKQSRNIIKAGIDSTDPQLAKLGLDYGMAKELEKILTSADARGRNRQLFNFTKLGGAGIGGLLSGAQGVVGGFLLEQIVNDPRFIKYASKGLKEAINAKLPKGVEKAGAGLYQTGRAGRTLTSSQMLPKSTNTKTEYRKQLENPFQDYTLVDQIAANMGLDVEEMRKKRKSNQLFSRYP